MKWFFIILLIAALFFVILRAGCYNRPKRNVAVPVTNFDVKRYMGVWYEIARLDHPFERNMNKVTAEYKLLPDGRINVINRGEKGGRMKQITGKARPVDNSGKGELKVRFFIFPMRYVVMELSPDYQYAMVGSSSTDYLWVLSRQSSMPLDVLNDLLRKAKKRGYDVEGMIFVKHDY